MTEQNMKKMYDNFVELGLTEKAKAISDIQRFDEFDPKVKAAREKAEADAIKKAEAERKKAEKDSKGDK